MPTFNPLLIGLDYPQPLIDVFIKAVEAPKKCQVDMNLLLRSCLATTILTLDYKRSLFNEFPGLTKKKVSILMRGFERERNDMSSLIHTLQIPVVRACAKMFFTASVLAIQFDPGYSQIEHQQIRAMLAAKYDSADKRTWIRQALDKTQSPLAHYVFGPLFDSGRQSPSDYQRCLLEMLIADAEHLVEGNNFEDAVQVSQDAWQILEHQFEGNDQLNPERIQLLQVWGDALKGVGDIRQALKKMVMSLEVGHPPRHVKDPQA